MIGATQAAWRGLRHWIAVDALAEVVMTTQGSLHSTAVAKKRIKAREQARRADK